MHGSIPRHYAEMVLTAVGSRGHDTSKVLLVADIDPDDWNSGVDLTPLQFGRIYQRALWLIGDEAFGTVGGEGVPNGSFRMLCLSIIHCKTLADAIVRAAEFCEVAIGYQTRPEIRIVGNRARLEWHPIRPVEQQALASSNQAPMTLLIILNLISWLLGQPLPVERVLLSADRRHRDLHQSFFDCDVEYGETRDAMEFSASVLDWPMTRSEDELERFLDDAMPTLLSPRQEAATWRNKILTVLAHGLENKLPNGDAIADRLNVSPATLRRRLASEGTSVQQIKDQYRCSAAMRFLASTALSQKDIAMRCGFENPADFNRAFRRWSGQTPGQYRTKLAPG